LDGFDWAVAIAENKDSSITKRKALFESGFFILLVLVKLIYQYAVKTFCMAILDELSQYGYITINEYRGNHDTKALE